ncbi:hypothetical protein [Jeotgalibacillus sp. JSM ZJ347]|uniref:hypothetical protein n=1 Tax=Jeotgalibacillus sp. JSM ZJ347 TaxID=3342117 RepID=UPI0035A8215D
MDKNLLINEIKTVLINHGGVASLKTIYHEVLQRNNFSFEGYKDYTVPIRKTIYEHSSNADIFKGLPGDQSDIFYTVQGKGKGFWGLRKRN